MRNWGVSGVIDFDLTENLAIKSITAIRDMRWKTGMDLDGSPLVMLQTSFNMEQQQISEELQLNGNALNGQLNYVVGVYYFREQGSLHDFVTFSEGLLQISGPNDLWTRNYAGFTQVDWRISDLVGVREVDVIPDPFVERGGCIVTCGATRIDAQVPAALERVREVLR